MKKLRYIDLGVASAREFWEKLVLPDYEQFMRSHSARDAVHAAFSAWHLHDWLFHEQVPGTKKDFQQSLLAQCPELGWVRDYVEAAKHRGLARPDVKVRTVEPDTPVETATRVPIGHSNITLHLRGVSPVSVVLDDGSTHQFSTVLTRVIDFWRDNWFRAAPL